MRGEIPLVVLVLFVVCTIVAAILYPPEPAVTRQVEILNYLDRNLKRGGENLGLLSLVFTLDSYYILKTEIPDKAQIVAYLDSKQLDDGTWATGQKHYVPITAQILMFYNRSGITPSKSLEPFFSTVDTWEKVVKHVQTYDPGNRWGGLWGYVTCYVVCKGESPPWTEEFLATANSSFETWAYSNHQRTHLIGNLFQLGVPVPRTNDVVNITLSQQKEDGSWDYQLRETAGMIATLKLLRNQTTTDQNVIDIAIGKGLKYVESCYKRIEQEGKTYAGFATNPSEPMPDPEATAFGVYSLLNPESDVWLRRSVGVNVGFD